VKGLRKEKSESEEREEVKGLRKERSEVRKQREKMKRERKSREMIKVSVVGMAEKGYEDDTCPNYLKR